MTRCTYHAQQSSSSPTQEVSTGLVIELPADEEERAVLRSRVFTTFSGVAIHFRELGLMVSDETVAELGERLEILESLVLVWLLFVLQLRGASVAACEQYSATSDGDLPFRGAEQALFDAVLVSLNGNPGTISTRSLIAKVASTTERVVQHITQRSGVSRAVLCALMELELKHG